MNLIHLRDQPAPRYIGLAAHPFDLTTPPSDRVAAAKPYVKPGPRPSKLQMSVTALMSEGERKAARILLDNRRVCEGGNAKKAGLVDSKGVC